MFKIIIALWFLMYIYKLFSKNSINKNILNKTKEVVSEMSPDDFANKTKIQDMSKETSEKLMGLTVWVLIFGAISIFVYILNYIFMFSMIKYDNTFITLGYIILSLIMFISDNIKNSKNNKNKDEFLNDLNKVKSCSFKNILMRIINVSYWGYAVYLLYFLDK
jgi:hypothetical protein